MLTCGSKPDLRSGRNHRQVGSIDPIPDGRTSRNRERGLRMGSAKLYEPTRGTLMTALCYGEYDVPIIQPTRGTPMTIKSCG